MSDNFLLPPLGENITSGVVVKVLVAPGNSIAKEQTVIELETDKAVVEVPSSISGTVKEVFVKVGQKAKVGEKIFSFESQGQAQPAQAPVAAPAKTTPAPKVETKKVEAPTPKPQPQPVAGEPGSSAGPAVRKLARELEVNLATVRGSGPGGRITPEDVKAAASGSGSAEAPVASAAPSVPEAKLPDFSKWGVIDRKAMSPVRLATARAMSQAWNTIPHVTQFDQADITDVLELRKKFAPRVEAAGGKLTLTAVLLKVIGSALKVFPQFNASIDVGAEEIVYKKYCHVGVAVDTDRGLIVPVVRDVDKKNILELSVELTTAADRARQHKTSLDEMQGGSFTITNLGGIGGGHFTPIVHWPEVAILGVGQADLKPVWKKDQWKPRTILPLSLSYDHRVIDGADAARFLKWVADAVQEPFLMGLEG